MEELKNKQTGFLVLLLLSMFLNLPAQDSATYTLQKCIDIALQNNQAIIMADLQTQSSHAALQQSRASALPYISGYANQGISTGKSINPYTNAFINQEVNTGQYGLNAGITLFNGLSIVNNMQQNAFNHKANKMDYEQAKMDISIQVSLAYLQVLNNEELVNQALSQMAATQTQLDRLEILRTNNAITPSVFYDTRGQLASDKLNLINTRAALLTAKLNLSQLLNMSFPSNSSFEKVTAEPEPATPLIKEDLYKELVYSIPGIKASDLRKASALKILHAARGSAFPTLSLNGSLGSNYSSAALSQKATGVYDAATGAYVSIGGNQVPVYETQSIYQNSKILWNDQVTNNFNTYIGLSLQIPLFNGLKNKMQISYAKIKYKQFDIQQKATRVKYKVLIEQISNDLKNAYELYQIVKEQVNDYNESFKIATAKFEKGAITTVEYTSSKTNYDKAKANLINSHYDVIFRSKVLDFYKKGS